MRVVAALGGNALARRGEQISTDVQRRNLAAAMRCLVDHGFRVVATGGGGMPVVVDATGRPLGVEAGARARHVGAEGLDAPDNLMARDTGQASRHEVTFGELHVGAADAKRRRRVGANSWA